MDPIRNPYAPGAGTPPPELAGRDELRDTVRIALARVQLGRPTKSVLMVGLRGVGSDAAPYRARPRKSNTMVVAMLIVLAVASIGLLVALVAILGNSG
jgi:hypothetical protein